MRKSQTGFTIIELMIATAVLAVILITTTKTIIVISNIYTNGTVQSQTQDTSRTILSDISNDIEFNDPNTINLAGLATRTDNTDEYWFCVGNDIYVFTLDKYLSSETGSAYSPYGLLRYSQTAGCPQSIPAIPSPLTSDYTELMNSNERLGQLDVTQVSINGTIGYIINLEIAYGTNLALDDIGTLVTNPNQQPPTYVTGSQYVNGTTTPPSSDQYVYTCDADNTAGSFCALSTLTTTTVPRINND